MMRSGDGEIRNGEGGDPGSRRLREKRDIAHHEPCVHEFIDRGGVALFGFNGVETRRRGHERIPPMNCARERSSEKKGSDYRYTERNRREKLKIFRGEGS